MALKEDEAPLKLETNQISYNGLYVLSGQIAEECNNDLRWPDCIDTYKNMAKDATISPALNLMEMQIAEADWSVKIPEGYEGQLKDKAKFIESVMLDMEHTWNDFIRTTATFSRYGFAPMEKVFRVRKRSEGSRFDDGLYGLRKLPLIAQDTISSWEWSEDGRSLTGIKQKKNIPKGKGQLQNISLNEDILIPRNKFILFRADPQKDSPIGTSPLNSVYMAWRFKSELEKFESISIANDLRGMKVFKIPPRYMSESASEEEKATYEVFKTMLRGLHMGDQSGVIIPQAFDDNGKPLFDFEVISILGQSAHNLNDVVERYKKAIITGILNPRLILGQDGSGSFALSESLGEVTSTVVKARLKEIRDQLNHDLIPQLFAINGWDTSVLPYFTFNLPDSVSIDDLGKFIQRVSSVGLIKQDATTVNWIASKLGMPTPFDDVTQDIEEVREQLTGYSSRGGEGMETAGEGTSKGVFSSDSGDASAGNMENE